jgi:hypothetical protein
MNPRYTIYIEDVDLDADIVYDHTEQRYLRVEEYADRLNRLEAELEKARSGLRTQTLIEFMAGEDIAIQIYKKFEDLEAQLAALSPAAAPVAG